MSQTKLGDAATVLREAAAGADGDAASRLADQADAIESLADRDRAPDHGRVARHQQKLKDLKDDHPETADAVDEANSLLNDYRETIEGV